MDRRRPGVTAVTTMSATIWPPHTFDWFAELAANNHKAWYDANKAAYAEIEAASTEVLNTLAEGDGPAAGADVKVFRLRRDARFAKGQPPYKTEQRAGLMRPDGVVWWFDLDAAGVTLAVGQPQWDKPQLAAARAALADPATAAALLDALGTVTDAGLALDEPELKRPLKDLPDDHPDPDLTRHKHLTVSRRLDRPGWLLRPGAADRLSAAWAAAEPLAHWLADHVGPPTEPGAR